LGHHHHHILPSHHRHHPLLPPFPQSVNHSLPPSLATNPVRMNQSQPRVILPYREPNPRQSPLFLPSSLPPVTPLGPSLPHGLRHRHGHGHRPRERVDGSLHYYQLDIVGFCLRAWLGVRFGSQSHQRLTTGHIQYIYIYMYICTGNHYCMYLSRYISCTYILHQSLPPVHPYQRPVKDVTTPLARHIYAKHILYGIFLFSLQLLLFAFAFSPHFLPLLSPHYFHSLQGKPNR
jgi:hypothetical protein